MPTVEFLNTYKKTMFYFHVSPPAVEVSKPSKKIKPKRPTLTTLDPVPSDLADDDTTTIATAATTQTLLADTAVTVKTAYDNLDRLAEISLTNQKDIPRILLQVIAILGPVYPFLFRLTLKRCRFNKYTVHELINIIDVTDITELNFDGSYSKEANYAMLLEKTSNLAVLLLPRCSVNDLICEQIMSKLGYFEPASKNLRVLNLSGNMITDDGAMCVAFVLRSNRTLRHLDLSGNLITDEGAISILESLMSFPLTYDEYIGRRIRYSEHVKYLIEVTESYLAEEVAVTPPPKEKLKSPRKSTVPASPTPPATPSVDDEAYHKQRAEMLATEAVGPFIDPFGIRSTILKDGYRYCTGNLTLTSLNLSYNNLHYPSLKKLADVVRYQRTVRQMNETGLLRFSIEGNNLPVEAMEYQVIAEVLGRYAGKRPVRKSEVGRRKSRAAAKPESKVQISTETS